MLALAGPSIEDFSDYCVHEFLHTVDADLATDDLNSDQDLAIIIISVAVNDMEATTAGRLRFTAAKMQTRLFQTRAQEHVFIEFQISIAGL